jgi:phage shock protein C
MNGRLYRSTTDRMISGVAGGLADYLNLDPSLVRIVWAVLMFVTGGLFFLVYIVMWIVLPEATGGTDPRWRDVTPGAADDPAAGEAGAGPRPFARTDRIGSGNGRLIFGLVLITLGAYFLLRNDLPDIAWDRFWPVLLVLAGAALLIGSLRRESR